MRLIVENLSKYAKIYYKKTYGELTPDEMVEVRRKIVGEE